MANQTQQPSNQLTKPNIAEACPPFFSISEAADRWRCSRGTVYNRLRADGATVVDFAKRGKRGQKLIPASVVLEIERRCLKRLN